MRKLFLLPILIFALTPLFYFQSNGSLSPDRILYYYPCEKQIKYRIDTVDASFNLTSQDVRSASRNAADIWNRLYGETLFEYDPQGDLSINLLFDERQQLTNDYSRLQSDLQQKESDLSPKLAEFKRRVEVFNQRATRLDSDISYWNSQGGAPPDEYEKLTREQESIRNEARELNDLSRSLNQSTDVFNQEVRATNRAFDSLTQTLAVKPEEGIYDGAKNRIEVYFNNNQSELIRTVAHEMGHARGLGHASSPEAIMYPKTTAILSPSNEDNIMLQNACQKKSKVALFQQRLSFLLASFEN